MKVNVTVPVHTLTIEGSREDLIALATVTRAGVERAGMSDRCITVAAQLHETVWKALNEEHRQ